MLYRIGKFVCQLERKSTVCTSYVGTGRYAIQLAAVVRPHYGVGDETPAQQEDGMALRNGYVRASSAASQAAP